MKSFRSLLLVLAAASAAFSSAWADPPGRVGRISLVSGDAVLRTDYYAEGQAAAVNWPVTGGNTLATMPGARAEVRIGSTAIRLDGDSELEFAAVDDGQVRLRLLHGTVAVRLRDAQQAGEWELYTPQGRVALRAAGAYRLETGRAPDTSALTVFQGEAQFSGEGLELVVRPGQRAEILGARHPSYVIAPQAWDDFDTWCVARDRRDDESRSARYVSREMTGYEDLDEHGEWRESVDYGPVWYPRHVPVGWAPYRTGHWAWVPPWGWTWVDEAPWGFAPFHYGRWVFLGGFWAWAPGPVLVRPVYAPALVVWLGRPGWHASFSFGVAPAVGWFPLGPREVFVPAYRCSPLYVRRINAPHVTNLALIEEARRGGHERVAHAHRMRPGAATVVPAQVLSRGDRVDRFALGREHARSTESLPVAAAPAVDAPRFPQRPRTERRDRDETGPGAPRHGGAAGAASQVIGNAPAGVAHAAQAQEPRGIARERDVRKTEREGVSGPVRRWEPERALAPARERERSASEARSAAAPQPRAAEPAPVIVEPGRSRREREERPLASPRPIVGPVGRDAPPQPRQAVREAERPRQATEAPRREVKQAPAHRSKEPDKGRGSERREPDRDAKGRAGWNR